MFRIHVLKLKNIVRCRQKFFQNSGRYKNKCWKWHEEYMLKEVQFEVDPPIFEFGVYANSAVDTDETIARVATLIFDYFRGL